MPIACLDVARLGIRLKQLDITNYRLIRAILGGCGGMEHVYISEEACLKIGTKLQNISNHRLTRAVLTGNWVMGYV
jgi:hypothetical protein